MLRGPFITPSMVAGKLMIVSLREESKVEKTMVRMIHGFSPLVAQEKRQLSLGAIPPLFGPPAGERGYAKFFFAKANTSDPCEFSTELRIREQVIAKMNFSKNPVLIYCKSFAIHIPPGYVPTRNYAKFVIDSDIPY